MIESINHATKAALQKGIRVLQTHFFDPDQRAHVLRLLEWMAPKQGAHIIDAGSGIGEVSRIMSEARPDLRFTLVNLSEYQISMSPVGGNFSHVLADFTRSGLDSGCADVVMFNSALCQMPINDALGEAQRLLKEGGRLFLNDLAIKQSQFISGLHATFMSADEWKQLVCRHGFGDPEVFHPVEFDLSHFKEAFQNDSEFESIFSGAKPFVAEFEKMSAEQTIRASLARHERIALQFSGGKDSLACLYLLRDHLDRITVYWVNTGAAYPETIESVDSIRSMCPNFVEIAGNQPKVIEAFGIPSDIVPTDATMFGRMATGVAGQVIQDRYSCCFRTIMEPLGKRMIQDGITLIIRGQRGDDEHKAPVRSGHVEDGIEYLFPLEGWSRGQVLDYLQDHGVTLPRFYDYLKDAADCMTCSAWWEKGELQYLKRFYPAEHGEVMRRMEIIQEANGKHIAAFNREIS